MEFRFRLWRAHPELWRVPTHVLHVLLSSCPTVVPPRSEHLRSRNALALSAACPDYGDFTVFFIENIPFCSEIDEKLILIKTAAKNRNLKLNFFYSMRKKRKFVHFEFLSKIERKGQISQHSSTKSIQS